VFVEQKIAPGINFAVLEGENWQKKSIGKISETTQTHENIYYDLASITKVFTALIWVKSMNKFNVDLDTPAKRVIRWLSGQQISNTLRLKHLLSHQNGLEIIQRFDRNQEYSRSEIQNFFEDPNNLKQTYKNSRNPYEYNYLDTAYVLLGRELEERYNEPLDGIFAKFCQQYHLSGLTFCPLKNGIEPEQIAPNSSNPQGIPFDPKNRFYGGASGHSGVFGTLNGLQNFVEKIIDPSNPFELSTPVFNQLFLPSSPPSEDTQLSFSIGGWRTGFIAKNQKLPNISGFTGPFVVVEPKKQKAIVATTNIIDPSNTNNTRVKYKMFLHDLIR
jgi:CubicO group peptidase (beta-lactamase class C family)